MVEIDDIGVFPFGLSVSWRKATWLDEPYWDLVIVGGTIVFGLRVSWRNANKIFWDVSCLILQKKIIWHCGVLFGLRVSWRNVIMHLLRCHPIK